VKVKHMNKLRPGAHIRIVGLASAVNQGAIQSACDELERRGFHVSLGEHLFLRWQDDLHLAGDDRSRAEDLMDALSDPSVDAVLSARGGYGAMRLLPYLDRDRILASSEKPFMGFSDVTAIHHYLGNLGWSTIHGPNAHSDWSGSTGDLACALLTGNFNEITQEPLQPLGDHGELLRAPWRGGNLALVAALVGTPWQPDWDGVVLYLEEVHEKPYRIDRMMQQLYLSGILGRVRGMVFGEALFDDKPHDEAVKAMISDVAGRAGKPAWWGIHSGHSEPMISLPMGVPLDIGKDGRVRLAAGGFN